MGKQGRAANPANPVLLVMQRGMHTEMRMRTMEDGTKEKQLALVPQGVVLGPNQTMVLASHMDLQQRKLEILAGILERAQDAGFVDAGPTSQGTDQQKEGVDNEEE